MNPIPRSEANISPTRTPKSASATPKRKPVKISGSAAGKRTVRIVWTGESRSERAVLRTTGRIVRTPFIVRIISGKIA